MADLGNEEMIISWLENGGEGVTLTPYQKELLERWSYADEMIRDNVGKGREKIANMIRAKYGVHRSTAYAYIVAAERVFSSSAPLNKKYRVQLRIEALERRIKILQDSGNDKDAASYEKTLQKYYDMYPDTQPERSPRNIFFFFSDTAKLETDITEDIAFEEADDILKQLKEENDL